MGSYKKILNDYKNRGSFNEDKMWLSVEALDKAILEELEESNPELYWNFMRDQHEIFCGKHFDEKFAKWEVERMHHDDIEGQHWSLADVKSIFENMRSKLPNATTIWDFYVALNANWHDKVDLYKGWFENYEEKIINDAINFYFMDEDAPDGKIWVYMRAMSKG